MFSLYAVILFISDKSSKTASLAGTAEPRPQFFPPLTGAIRMAYLVAIFKTALTSLAERGFIINITFCFVLKVAVETRLSELVSKTS